MGEPPGPTRQAEGWSPVHREREAVHREPWAPVAVRITVGEVSWGQGFVCPSAAAVVAAAAVVRAAELTKSHRSTTWLAERSFQEKLPKGQCAARCP